MSDLQVSIVIPMYNEAARIRATLHQICAYLDQQSYKAEIVVVDDGSFDDSVQIVRDNLASHEHRILENGQNRGKGFSVKSGMLAATGQYIFFMDADLSTPIEELGRCLPYLENDYDCVIGSRALPDSDIQVHQSSMRELMGRVFNFFARLVSFKGIEDSQCGFKGFRQKVAYDLFGRQKLDGFSFDVEILFLAQKLGYKIKEEPVQWSHSAQTRVHLFLDPVKMFLDIIRIRFLHRGL